MLQLPIDETKNTLNAIGTQQQIQAEYQPHIDKLVRDKKAAIKSILSDIRKNYSMPKYED